MGPEEAGVGSWVGLDSSHPGEVETRLGQEVASSSAALTHLLVSSFLRTLP